MKNIQSIDMDFDPLNIVFLRLSRIVSDLEVVEVAGVEPASCGVFMQASTSLVGSYMFSPEVLASDLLTPEHRLRFH